MKLNLVNYYKLILILLQFRRNIVFCNSNDLTNPSTTTHISEPESSTTLKPIDLDVKDTKSTETFDCLKKDGFAKYTPQSGYRFTSVKKSGGSCSRGVFDIWHTKDSNDYATAVVRDGIGACSRMNNVTIFFDNNHKHFTKSNSTWVECPLFKLYTSASDSTISQELETTSFTLRKKGNNILYDFKDVSKCTEIKYIYRTIQANSAKVVTEEVSVWKHDSNKHSENYPKFLRFYWPTKMSLSFGNSFTIFNKGGDGKWDKGLFFDINLFGKDSNNQLKELDVTSYELTEEGDEHIFKFKTETKCSEVKHEGNELWKHDSTRHGDKYPVLLRYKKDGSKLLINFNEFFVLCTKESDNKLKANEFFIKFYASSSNNTYTLLKVNTSFDIEKGPNYSYFKIKTDINCTLIKLDGEQFWKYDPQNHEGQYPLSVRYSKSNIVLNFNNYFIFYEKDKNNKWKSTDFNITMRSNNMSGSSNLLEVLGPNYYITDEGDYLKFVLSQGFKVSVVSLDKKKVWASNESLCEGSLINSLRIWKDKKKLILNCEELFIVYGKSDSGSWDNPVVFNIKLYGNDPGDETKTITLEDKHYQMKEENNNYVFILKDGIKCSCIKVKGLEIWKHDQNEYKDNYPKSVTYKVNNTMLLVSLDDFCFFYEKNHNGVWMLKKSITLDISSNITTGQYNYNTHELFDTFFPKEGYVFGIVKQGDAIIYKSTSPYDLSSKVLVYKTSYDIKFVDLVMPNKSVKRFSKIDNKNEWYQKLTPLSLDIKSYEHGYIYTCLSKGVGRYTSKNTFGFKTIHYGTREIWNSEDDINYTIKVDVSESEDLVHLILYLYNGEVKEITISRVLYALKNHVKLSDSLSLST